MMYEDLEFSVNAAQNTAVIDIEGLEKYLSTHPGIDEIVIRNDLGNHADEIFLNLFSAKTQVELKFLPKVRLEGGNAKLKIVSKFEKVVYAEEQFQNFSEVHQEKKQHLDDDKKLRCLRSIDKFLSNTKDYMSNVHSMQVISDIKQTVDISFIPKDKIEALKEYCCSSSHTSKMRGEASLMLAELSLHDVSIHNWFINNLESFDDISVVGTAINVMSTSNKTEYLTQKKGFVENLLLIHQDKAPDSVIINSLQFLCKAMKPSSPLDAKLLEYMPEFMKKSNAQVMLDASKLVSMSHSHGHDLKDLSFIGSVIAKINGVAGEAHSKVLENLFDVMREKVTSFNPSMQKAIEQSFTHLNSEGKKKYVDLVKQFVSDSYKFDDSTIAALKDAIIFEKKDAMRKGLSDLLFDIASNNTEYLGTISDFFFDCLQENGGIFSDSFSMKVIVDEIFRFVQYFSIDISIGALRKLNELAVDKLRPLELCLKSIELLKLSLIYSKEVPLRPVIQRLSESYDSTRADTIASELVSYLELRFLHGIDSIEDFVIGLKAVKPFSRIAQGLLASNSLKDALANKTSVQHFQELQALIIYTLSGGAESDKTPLISRFAESLKYGQLGNFERNLDLLQLIIGMDAKFTDNLFDGLVNILKTAHGNTVSNSLERIVGKAIALLKVATETNHLFPYDQVKKALEGLHADYKGLYSEDIKIILEYLAAQQEAFGDEDRDSDSMFDRLQAQNLQYAGFFNKDGKLSELRKIYDSVLTRFESVSELLPDSGVIKAWDVKKVGDWATKVIEVQLTQESFPEILAVMMQANKLDTGNLLRGVQIISIASLMTSTDKGLILQISTGEGKSTITAISAAIKALFGEKVDVITSSPILAERDVEERMRFFSMLKISSSFNPTLSSKSGKINPSNIDAHKREAYRCQVVYGDASSFQGDLVKDMLFGSNIREGRGFGTVIVDEVDSMLIDDNSKRTLISSGVAGMEYLEPIFAAIWYQAAAFEKQIVGNQFIEGEYTKLPNGEVILKDPSKGKIHKIQDINSFRKSNLKQMIPNILDNCVRMPSHLRKFVEYQKEYWVDSILTASSMDQFKHYMVMKNSRGNQVIAPVDYTNTGIVNNNMNWSDGVHQFLQLQNQLKMTPESFLTSFISNLTFFQQYGSKIYGMTGTLGSSACREMLGEVYDLDLGFIPTYQVKKFTKLEPIVVPLKVDDGHGGEKHVWVERVIDSISDITSKKQPVLVICETIQKVLEIKDALLSKYPYLASKMRVYSRTDNEEASATEKLVDSGEVIIATNLAGRGTDFKLNMKAIKEGGLHVCLTFLPSNLRVEEQAFGRAARSGQPGSGQLITSEEDISRKMLLNKTMTHDFNKVERARTYREAASLKDATLYGIYV